MKSKWTLKLLLATALTISSAPADITTQNVQNPNGAQMTFDTMMHDFGDIKQGDAVNFEFRFKNTGREPLIISTAVGSAGNTVPDWPKDPVAPGATRSIKVTFNSTAKEGAQDRTITITSNSRDGQVVLHIKGNVKVPPPPVSEKKPQATKKESEPTATKTPPAKSVKTGKK